MDPRVDQHVLAWEGPLMGGTGAIDLTLGPGAGSEDLADALRLGRSVARRLGAWADRLSRFRPASDLSRLNAGPAVGRARPTLAAVLAWAIEAAEETDGIVDVSRLDDRLAAEDPAAVDPGADGPDPIAALADGPDDPRWRLRRSGRGAIVTRAPGVRIDLDGVAKGWLADRALRLLAAAPGALVDADGDLAARVAPGDTREVAVANPRGGDIATLRLTAGSTPEAFGVATSGTTVHRWGDGRHHLIDPRTGRPAESDLVQATVVARSARRAEALAKTLVILGSQEGFAFMETCRPLAAIAVRADGEVVASPASLRLLAA